MYHAYALLQPDSDLTLAALADRLRAKFPQARVTPAGDTIALSEGDWDYNLVLQSGPDVLAESEGLAGRIAGLDEDSPVRACDRRVEVWSETPDPFMEHFDKHFQVLDVFRSFSGVVLVDPKGAEVL
jgi:hypothetical protein